MALHIKNFKNRFSPGDYFWKRFFGRWIWKKGLVLANFLLMIAYNPLKDVQRVGFLMFFWSKNCFVCCKFCKENSKKKSLKWKIVLLALLKCCSYGEYIVFRRIFVKTSGASWTRPLRRFSIVAPSIKVGVFECVKPRLDLAWNCNIKFLVSFIFYFLL